MEDQFERDTSRAIEASLAEDATRAIEESWASTAGAANTNARRGQARTGGEEPSYTGGSLIRGGIIEQIRDMRRTSRDAGGPRRDDSEHGGPPIAMMYEEEGAAGGRTAAIRQATPVFPIATIRLSGPSGPLSGNHFVPERPSEECPTLEQIAAYTPTECVGVYAMARGPPTPPYVGCDRALRPQSPTLALRARPEPTPEVKTKKKLKSILKKPRLVLSPTRTTPVNAPVTTDDVATIRRRCADAAMRRYEESAQRVREGEDTPKPSTTPVQVGRSLVAEPDPARLGIPLPITPPPPTPLKPLTLQAADGEASEAPDPPEEIPGETELAELTLPLGHGEAQPPLHSMIKC